MWVCFWFVNKFIHIIFLGLLLLDSYLSFTLHVWSADRSRQFCLQHRSRAWLLLASPIALTPEPPTFTSYQMSRYFVTGLPAFPAAPLPGPQCLLSTLCPDWRFLGQIQELPSPLMASLCTRMRATVLPQLAELQPIRSAHWLLWTRSTSLTEPCAHLSLSPVPTLLGWFSFPAPPPVLKGSTGLRAFAVAHSPARFAFPFWRPTRIFLTCFHLWPNITWGLPFLTDLLETAIPSFNLLPSSPFPALFFPHSACHYLICILNFWTVHSSAHYKNVEIHKGGFAIGAALESVLANICWMNSDVKCKRR